MSRKNYKRFRTLEKATNRNSKDIVDESKIDEIRKNIKNRKRVFGRLAEINVDDMTYNELEYFESGLDSLLISIEKTKMPIKTIQRMFSVTPELIAKLVNNKEQLFKDIETNKKLKCHDLTQDNSIIFTEEILDEEIEEMKDDMFYLYKCLLSPEDVCEYFRVFPYEKVWDKHIRQLQERLRLEYTKDTMNYINSQDTKQINILEEYTEILDLGKEVNTAEVEGIKLWGV